MPESGTDVCLFCREPIRVEEPVIVLEHDGERETSLAHEPDIPERSRGLLVHPRCAPEGWERSNLVGSREDSQGRI